MGPAMPTRIMLSGYYDYRLVALSVLIAILAAYAALDLAGRVTTARGNARRMWLSGGAVAMGIGIWAMHYIGMEAFHLPVPVMYDWPTVLASLIAAILASGVALYTVSRKTMSRHAQVLRRRVHGRWVSQPCTTSAWKLCGFQRCACIHLGW